MIRESFPRPFAIPRSPSNPSICHTHTSNKTSRRFTSSRSGWTCGQINRIQNPTQNPRDSLRKQAGQAAGAAPTLRYGPAGDSACPLRLGVYYGRKVPFRPVHTARNSRDRTAQSRPARPLVSPFPPQGSPLTRPAKSGVFYRAAESRSRSALQSFYPQETVIWGSFPRL